MMEMASDAHEARGRRRAPGRLGLVAASPPFLPCGRPRTRRKSRVSRGPCVSAGRLRHARFAVRSACSRARARACRRAVGDGRVLAAPLDYWPRRSRRRAAAGEPAAQLARRRVGRAVRARLRVAERRAPPAVARALLAAKLSSSRALLRRRLGAPRRAARSRRQSRPRSRRRPSGRARGTRCTCPARARAGGAPAASRPRSAPRGRRRARTARPSLAATISAPRARTGRLALAVAAGGALDARSPAASGAPAPRAVAARGARRGARARALDACASS